MSDEEVIACIVRAQLHLEEARRALEASMPGEAMSELVDAFDQVHDAIGQPALFGFRFKIP